MGTETFSTEYPAAVRATWDSPTKTYKPVPVVSAGDEDRHSATVLLQGEITSEQSREQHYEKVTVEKGKRLAFGLVPRYAEDIFRPENSLVPLVGWTNKGNGKYQKWTSSNSMLGELILDILWLPNSLLVEPLFGKYECSTHHWVDNKRGTAALLSKFPASERPKIGAWTWLDERTHPQKVAGSNCTHFGAFGFHKYCTYVIRGPEKLSRTTPVDPEVTTSVRSVSGPYTVTLRLPALGYSETVAVEPGAKEAGFNLVDAANGDASAEGTVLYALPAEGVDAIRRSEDRAILLLAVEREWPVTVELPAPRPGSVATAGEHPAGETPPARGPLYSVESIERPASGELVVRVVVNDTSKTFDVDRAVQPQIRRMVREDFRSANPGIPEQYVRETLPYETEDGGKTLVYSARAFSVLPVVDGWEYDSDSRRGWVRLCVSDGMSADEAKLWARDNVSSIVSGSSGGTSSSSGAVYRVLGEKFENGVLMVEFEALE